MRTITQILIDADKAKSSIELDVLRMEISNNDKRKYPLIQIEFAEEHFKSLYRKLNPVKVDP